eukprot:CAMPEP_0113604890 /NCGR_PEP_ID=MMETSP0017_2-20120614/2033_1 /TAXON_ID=2856 /ORGANISM="Cylindrotheca closterium" /LENGTH=353 /DNA_ID=CAMNT_0000513339 /DNA_START=278 /DNA_END=1336 /DNA_ORIENTATION=- /assembly_acc=CAM_ASM_000147
MGVLNKIADLFMVFVYFFVVLGCWCVVFFYVYPFIDESKSVSNTHKWIGYFVFVACFGSWRLANKSTPGFITPKTFKRYDHYPYDALIFPPGRRCESTNIIKIPRSKFDRIKYKANIPRYDHFCGWVYNTIGEENYRWFLLFLVVHVIMCSYGSTVCFLLFRGEIRDKQLLELTFFDRATGEEVESTWFIVLQFLFAQETAICTVMIVMGVMALALGGFLGYHVHITSKNQTTNEDDKWKDVLKWYKTEKKRWDEAVAAGLVKPDETEEPTNEKKGPVVGDGDVTCTGASAAPAESQEGKSPDDEYFDPGAEPKNLHNKGFKQNWMEVLFPISLRKDVLKHGGYSRPPPGASR